MPINLCKILPNSQARKECQILALSVLPNILKPNLRDAFWIGLFSFGAPYISSTCVQRALNASVSAESFQNFSHSNSFPPTQNQWLMSSRERGE